MIKLIHLVRDRLRDSRGFTLMEMMLALAIGALVMTGVFAVWTQMFNVTAANSNYMAAFRQVQSGGDWISHDAQMTQGVYKMVATALDGDIVASSTADIQVDDIDGFPTVGAICIGEEIILYTGIDAASDEFINITRGYNAVAHSDNDPVTLFLGLSWTDWDGNQHRVAYSLREDSRQLVRTYLEHLAGETDPDVWVLLSSNTIAEALDTAATSSSWDYYEKELTVVITAQIDEEAATRTYRVHPRPLF
jgi:prepilin-type N-terminal cleavage/methylation domain-containing protein